MIKWKHFPRNWPFVRRIYRSPVNSQHKGQWRGALMFSLIGAWTSSKQTMETPVIWDAIALIMTSLWCVRMSGRPAISYHYVVSTLNRRSFCNLSLSSHCQQDSERQVDTLVIVLYAAGSYNHPQTECIEFLHARSANPSRTLVQFAYKDWTTENKRSSICQLCRYWWHRKLSLRQLTVPPMTAMLSNWRFLFVSDRNHPSICLFWQWSSSRQWSRYVYLSPDLISSVVFAVCGSGSCRNALGTSWCGWQLLCQGA